MFLAFRAFARLFFPFKALECPRRTYRRFNGDVQGEVNRKGFKLVCKGRLRRRALTLERTRQAPFP
jgi:hypothetical protein